MFGFIENVSGGDILLPFICSIMARRCLWLSWDNPRPHNLYLAYSLWILSFSVDHPLVYSSSPLDTFCRLGVALSQRSTPGRYSIVEALDGDDFTRNSVFNLISIGFSQLVRSSWVWYSICSEKLALQKVWVAVRVGWDHIQLLSLLLHLLLKRGVQLQFCHLVSFFKARHLSVWQVTYPLFQWCICLFDANSVYYRLYLTRLLNQTAKPWLILQFLYVLEKGVFSLCSTVH